MNSLSPTSKITWLIAKLFKDKDRKSIIRIIGEVLYLSIVHRSIPYHYFSRYLFRKDRTNLLDYIPNKKLHRIKPHFNDPDVSEVLENKLYFNLFYEPLGISVPKILMYNHRKMFVTGNTSVEINNSTDFRSILAELINRPESDGSVFIKRTYGSYGGDKIFKVTSDQLATDSLEVDNLYKEVIRAGYLFQETIKQHPDMCKLNPSCVNTIRFDTFIDQDGKVNVISAYLRMSINNLHVDNIGSGGCCVAVDMQTGKLKKEGYLVFQDYGGDMLTEHPVTKTVFEGFSLPYFEQAKALVIRAATLMPGLRLIGWDVAIGVSGPVLIEGNFDYDLTGNDLTEGGYRNNPVFRKVLEEIHYS
ncbi:MAG: sugar-transfer associated ATP-grasp domain-containing protein [Bacteroidota bacterium]|nr:sugar-transfer associated ATP-grasp domain-containing protein [Bacteroidota bacterium]